MSATPPPSDGNDRLSAAPFLREPPRPLDMTRDPDRPTRLISTAHRLLKKLLLFGVAILLLYRGTASLIIAQRELSPSRVDVTRLPAGYSGEHWLALTGYPATDHPYLLPAYAGEGQPAGRVDLWVPLVPADWDLSQPVHAVVLFGSMKPSEARATLRTLDYHAARTFTGSRLNLNYHALFPDLRFAEPVILLQPNATPLSAKTGLFCIVFGLVLLVVSAYAMIHDYRLYRAGEDSLELDL